MASMTPDHCYQCGGTRLRHSAGCPEAQARPVEGTRGRLAQWCHAWMCLLLPMPHTLNQCTHSNKSLFYVRADALLRDFTVTPQGSLSAEDDTRYSIAHACVGPMAEAAGYLEAHGTDASKDISAKLRAAVKSQFIDVTPRAPEPTGGLNERWNE